MGVATTLHRKPGGSGPSPETVVRTARGTSHEWGQGDIQSHAMSGVSVEAGAWLLVGLVHDEAYMTSAMSITLAGVELSTLASRIFASSGVSVTLWGAYFPSAVTNGTLMVTFDTSEGAPSGVAMVATQVAGLATANALDQSVSANGTGTTPSSGATGTPAQAHEFVWGLVATAGPPSDSAGTWTNGLSAGQRVGEDGGSQAVTVSEGFRVASVQEAQTAAKTGITSRAWGAICATFRAAA